MEEELNVNSIFRLEEEDVIIKNRPEVSERNLSRPEILREPIGETQCMRVPVLDFSDCVRSEIDHIKQQAQAAVVKMSSARSNLSSKMEAESRGGDSAHSSVCSAESHTSRILFESTHDGARRNLVKHLRNGICVFLYSQNGKPRREILNCDSTGSILIWLPEFDPSDLKDDDILEPRNVLIKDILDIQLGRDIDPHTPTHVLLSAAANNEIRQEDVMKALEKKQKDEALIMRHNSEKHNSTNVFDSWFSPKQKYQVLYGTEELRELCTEDQLELSLAIFLADRTLNLLCQSRKDFDGLVKNLKILLEPPDLCHGTDKMKSKCERVFSEGDGQMGYCSSVAARKYGSFRKSFAEFYDSIDTTLIESILEEQDRIYGVNMYTSLRPGDEIVVQNYLLRGFSLENALRRLFLKRYEPHSRISNTEESRTARKSSFSVVDHIFVKSSIRDLKANDVLILGTLLRQQEEDYGTNMFNSIGMDDEETFLASISAGIPQEQVALELFNNKVSRGSIKLQRVQDGFMSTNVNYVIPLSYGSSTAQLPYSNSNMANYISYSSSESSPYVVPNNSLASGIPAYHQYYGPTPNVQLPMHIPYGQQVHPETSFYVPHQFNSPTPTPQLMGHTAGNTSTFLPRPPAPSYAPKPAPTIPSVKAVSVQALSDNVTSTSTQPRALSRTSSAFGWFFSGGGNENVDPRCKTADIKRITEMGFSHDQAVSALMVNDFNLARAIDSLTSTF